MEEGPNNNIPKLRPAEISSQLADLLLEGTGEGAALDHPKMRKAWHSFFFSIMGFVAWYLTTRIAIAPSFGDSTRVVAVIRSIDLFIYACMIIILAFLIYSHHRFMLVPRLSVRFRTILFFFACMVFLFSRIYYSLFYLNKDHFNISNDATLPTARFGIHGYSDLVAVLEFATLSGSIMLNISYPLIQPKSILACMIAMIESGVGFVFVAILVATFVEISSDRKLDNNNTEKG